MRNKPIIYLALAGFLMCGCQALEKKQQSGAVVEVNGHYLYRSTLDAMTLGLNSEDSLRVTQQYISQWAKDILLYDNAKANTNEEIERLVEDYRRSLYVHAYEEYLVERHMSKTVLDTTVEAIYTQLADRFKLDESIFHGILVVVPKDAPNLQKLRGWMAKQEMDHIEKYAYQNASGYELFTDKWLTTTGLMNHMPIDRTDFENKLKTKDQVEMTDSLHTYILQVTEKHLRGAAMPIEYARPEIEKTVLHARQVEFLQKERERLYNEAIQQQKIKFYEN